MARVTALKLVEEVPFFKKELDMSQPEFSEQAHSLHYALALPEKGCAELASHFIKKYSAVGDVILDPFAGAGEVALESALLGRIPYASDIDPLAAKIVSAKLNPADITEVTLKLQEVNLRRPVDSNPFRDYFSPFYDVNTYRELVNLRRFIHDNRGRVVDFIEFIALSLLHGHSAGYFSVYTFPQISILPIEQRDLNSKRRQTPDYRAIVPRILRKTASVMRDGIPSILSRAASESKISERDPRNLAFVRSAAVDLIMTRLPLPTKMNFSSELWLKLWFAGIAAEDYSRAIFSGSQINKWLGYMNEVFLEMARVLKPGGRLILELTETRVKGNDVFLDDLLLQMIEEELERYWDAEGIVSIRHKFPAIKNCLRPRESSKDDRCSRILVLRRR